MVVIAEDEAFDVVFATSDDLDALPIENITSGLSYMFVLDAAESEKIAATRSSLSLKRVSFSSFSIGD